MTKTIISHFYNEEYLLPWWLNHHKKFFDHGILIDYQSTDESCNIIKEICPKWLIIPSRNKYFDSAIIDKEVSRIESRVNGWKICLNTTEFLVGNYGILDNFNKKSQLLIGNYVFVDNHNTTLDHKKPLYEQIHFGFHQDPRQAHNNLHIGDRSLRSLHNFNIRYPRQGGRHFAGRESVQDLFIFYYGYLLNIHEMIKRKLQIQEKMSKQEFETLNKQGSHPNIITENSFKSRIIKNQLPKCKDISNDINRIVKLQEEYVNKKNNHSPLI